MAKSEKRRMPEQNLTNLLNMPNLEVLGYESTEDGVVLDIKPTLKVAICPKCKKPSASLHDYDEPRLIRAYEVVGLNVRHAKTHLRKG